MVKYQTRTVSVSAVARNIFKYIANIFLNFSLDRDAKINEIRMVTIKFKKLYPFSRTLARIRFQKMNTIIVLVIIAGVCAAAPQYYFPSGTVYPHPANLLTSALEDSLPNHLRNDFYKNPRIAAKLAQESWFINKEMQVSFTKLTVQMHLL